MEMLLRSASLKNAQMSRNANRKLGATLMQRRFWAALQGEIQARNSNFSQPHRLFSQHHAMESEEEEEEEDEDEDEEEMKGNGGKVSSLASLSLAPAAYPPQGVFEESEPAPTPFFQRQQSISPEDNNESDTSEHISATTFQPQPSSQDEHGNIRSGSERAAATTVFCWTEFSNPMVTTVAADNSAFDRAPGSKRYGSELLEQGTLDRKRRCAWETHPSNNAIDRGSERSCATSYSLFQGSYAFDINTVHNAICAV